jgi:hypothetical protein
MFTINFKRRLYYIDVIFSDYYISELESKFDKRKRDLFIQDIRDCMWIDRPHYEPTITYSSLFDIFLDKLNGVRNKYLDRVLTMYQKIYLNFIEYSLKDAKDYSKYESYIENYIDKVRYINLDLETSRKYFLYKNHFNKIFDNLDLESLSDISLEFLSVLRNTLLRQKWCSETDFNLLSKQLEKINIIINKREVLKKYNLSNDISFCNISNLNNNQFYEILTCLYNDNTDKIAKIFNCYDKSTDVEKSIIDSEIKCLVENGNYNNNYFKIIKECCNKPIISKHNETESDHLDSIELKTIT